MKAITTLLSLCALFVGIQGFNLERKLLHTKTIDLQELRNETWLKDAANFPATVNDYGDTVVANLDKLIVGMGFDPFKVDDIKKGYWWGNLRLYDIHFDGISTLGRSGDCWLNYCHDNKQLQIDLPLRFDGLSFESNYKVAIIGIGPRGSITGTVNNLEMMTSIVIDYNVNQAYVRLYEITKSGHISIKFHGNPITDWWNNILSNSVTTIFKGLILNVVDVVVKGIMDQLVDVINRVLQFVLG